MPRDGALSVGALSDASGGALIAAPGRNDIRYWAIFFASLLGTIFYLVFQAGQTLLDPFEGSPSDTPMSSIVRTIEINLLEQIGAKDIPAPVQPVDGRYLM